MPFLTQAGASAVYPEIFLAICAMALLMFGVFRKGETTDQVTIGAIVALAVAGLLVMNGSDSVSFGGAFVTDAFGRIMKMFTLFGSAVAVVLSVHFMKREKSERFDILRLIVHEFLGNGFGVLRFALAAFLSRGGGNGQTCPRTAASEVPQIVSLPVSFGKSPANLKESHQ